MLGGSLAHSANDATHLVINGGVTLKLYCCVSTCKHFVTAQWLTDSFARSQFLGEWSQPKWPSYRASQITTIPPPPFNLLAHPAVWLLDFLNFRQISKYPITQLFVILFPHRLLNITNNPIPGYVSPWNKKKPKYVVSWLIQLLISLPYPTLNPMTYPTNLLTFSSFL